MSRRPTKPGYTRNTLARLVSEVLDLCYDDGQGTAYEIVNRIIKTIEDGLKRGEDVKINGFGIFRLRTRPAMKRGCTYFYGNLNRHTAKAIVKLIPEKTYVHFEPSKVLLRMINEKT